MRVPCRTARAGAGRRSLRSPTRHPAGSSAQHSHAGRPRANRCRTPNGRASVAAEPGAGSPAQPGLLAPLGELPAAAGECAAGARPAPAPSPPIAGCQACFPPWVGTAVGARIQFLTAQLVLSTSPASTQPHDPSSVTAFWKCHRLLYISLFTPPSKSSKLTQTKYPSLQLSFLYFPFPLSLAPRKSHH